MNPSPELRIVLLSVLALLVGTTLSLPLLDRLRPHHDHAEFRARLRAWWIMAFAYLTVSKIHSSLSILGFALLSWIALREYLNRIGQVSLPLRVFCYLSVPIQYYWVWSGWYGMFIVFIPVYLFLYLPSSLVSSRESIRQAAVIHWGLMATVFCVSHAAYLLTFRVSPAGGAGLLLFVTLLTELGEAIRLLTPASKTRLAAIITMTPLVAGLLCASLTPISLAHALIAGVAIGAAGELGGRRFQQLRMTLGLADGPLRPGQGGALTRIIALTYSAPLFLHGFRYFYEK